jgi:type IV pilus assembly protein PilB
MQNSQRENEEQSTLARSQVLGLEYLDVTKVQKQLFPDILPIRDMYALKIVPIVADKANISFGVTTSTSQKLMNDLRSRFSDQRLRYYLISDASLRDYLELYDPPKKIIYTDIDIKSGDQNELIRQVNETLTSVRPDDMLAYMVQQAFKLKASDIHLESTETGARVRLRVDGVLHPIATFDKDRYRQLLMSIASAGNISTSSVQAQTGHINTKYTLATGEEIEVNLRLETVPTVYNTDVVMRLFNFKKDFLSIDNLGLEDFEKKIFEDILRHPTGLVLLVGPTGSGKTTTMYSMINRLNTPERKIITLEEPVEFYIDGIVQIPVDSEVEKAGFADKLRAVLRLDPDVVLVGEIRDTETAKTALQAALTGHLVMSTFHASSAAAALTRMMDAVGSNPLFASSIRLISAQRLIRKLDPETKIAYKPNQTVIDFLNQELATLPSWADKPDITDITLYHPGKSENNPFGYAGQISIREHLLMNEELAAQMRRPVQEVTTDMLQKIATKYGMLTMRQQGVLRAISGITTLEEVFRVVE